MRKQSADKKSAFRQQKKRGQGGQSQPAVVRNEACTTEASASLPLKDILDALPFYVMLVDECHSILQANTAVRAQLGVNPEDIVGKYCPKVIHGLDGPVDDCPLEEAVKSGASVEREMLDPESGHWVRSAVYPISRLTTDGRRIFFHMISDISDRKHAEEQLRGSEEKLRDLSWHLQTVREEEKMRLAREIHDELGQLLTGLKIDMSWITNRLPEAERSLIEKTKAMNQLIDEAVQTVKRISSELRPGVLDHLGLGAAIEWQTCELEKRTGIRFQFKSSPEDITLDRGRSTTLFRICQEALTNVVRHANATQVRVTLRKESKQILLKIRDNGKGIKEEQLADPKAFGLIGMRERALSFGGDVKISGIPDKGTLVVANIPLMVGKTHVENTDC